MKNIKNLLAAITLVGVLMIGASSARAGLLVSDFAGGGTTDNGCVQEDSYTGVIIAGYTGVIIAGFTGVIIAGFVDNSSPCSDINRPNQDGTTRKGRTNNSTGLLVSD